MASRASEPSPTACLGCREQKLRCTRDLPRCARCSRQDLNCHYPSPPDRKRLALQRLTTRSAKRQRLSPSEDMVQVFNIDNNPNSDTGRHQIRQGITSAKISTIGNPEASLPNDLPSRSQSNHKSSTSSEALSIEPLPPRGLGLYMLDIFFSRHPSVSTAFHEKSLFEAYLADLLPEHVLKSIFALSSISMRNEYSPSRPATNIKVISRDVSDQWATEAGSYVLAKVDRPSLESVQCLVTLALYWFAMGEMDRTKIHARLAYMSVRLLGFHSQFKDPVLDDPTIALENEIKRRSFWSAWLINGIIPHDDTLTRSHATDAIGVPLPSSDGSFYCGKIAGSQKMDHSWSSIILPSDGDRNEPSILAEIIKMFCVYFETQRFTVNSTQTSLSQNFERVSELYRRSKSLFAEIPQDLRFSGSFKGTKLGIIGRLFILHATYHLSIISLHKPLVPLFSGRGVDGAIHTEFMHSCAELVIQHADAFSDMAEAYLIHMNCDSSYLPPFTGYSAFTVASIHAIIMHKHGKGPSSLKLRKRLLVDLVLLRDIGIFWAPLQRLWKNITPLISPIVSLAEVDDCRRNLGNAHQTNSKPPSLTGDNSIDVSEFSKPYPNFEEVSQLEYVIADGSEKTARRPSSPISESVQPVIPSQDNEMPSSILNSELNGGNSLGPSYDETLPFTFEDDLFLSTLLDSDPSMLAFGMTQ